MLKTEENPPMLYPENTRIEELPELWQVAWTKSRNEKLLAWWLVQYDVTYFLPMHKKRCQRHGRKYTSLLPLFSGYLFFNGQDNERLIALKSNRIAQVLTVHDQKRFVRDLTQIYDALSRGVHLDPHPYLQAGQRCRVTRGSLMGLEGILIQKKEGARLVLQIDMLGQAAALEVDTDMVEPLA